MMEVALITAMVVVGVVLTVGVAVIPEVNPKCDQFVTSTKLVRSVPYSDVAYVEVFSPSWTGIRAAIETETRGLAAQGFQWGDGGGGSRNFCEAAPGTNTPNQRWHTGFTFWSWGAIRTNSSSTDGLLIPAHHNAKQYCAMAWFDVPDNRWIGLVSRHYNATSNVTDITTAPGPWYQTCTDLDRQQREGIVLVAVTLIVIAAVAVMVVMRRV